MDKEGRRKHVGEMGKSREVNLGEGKLSNKVRSKTSRQSEGREGLLNILLAVKKRCSQYLREITQVKPFTSLYFMIKARGLRIPGTHIL